MNEPTIVGRCKTLNHKWNNSEHALLEEVENMNVVSSAENRLHENESYGFTGLCFMPYK